MFSTGSEAKSPTAYSCWIYAFYHSDIFDSVCTDLKKQTGNLYRLGSAVIAYPVGLSVVGEQIFQVTVLGN